MQIAGGTFQPSRVRRSRDAPFPPATSAPTGGPAPTRRTRLCSRDLIAGIGMLGTPHRWVWRGSVANGWSVGVEPVRPPVGPARAPGASGVERQEAPVGRARRADDGDDRRPIDRAEDVRVDPTRILDAPRARDPLE